MVGRKQYPDYKDSGVEWLGKVPKHWEVKRLKNLATYNDEALDEKTDPDYEMEYVDISSVNLIDGIISSEITSFEEAPSRARRKVKDGDTIISTVRTYLKAIAAIKNPPENLVVSTGFAVIRPKPEIDPDYLGYLLQSEGFVGDVVSNSVGVSYPAINASVLAALPAVQPEIEEQQIIARFLEYKTAQIDTLIAKKETLLGRLAEKRTALINHAVTKGLDPKAKMRDSGKSWLGLVPEHWDVTRLRFLTAMNGGMTPSTSVEKYWDGGIPWVSPKDMKSERIVGSIDTVTDDALKDTALRLYPVGRVLIVVRGMILAHTFPVAVNDVSVTVNQDMKVLDTSMNPEYLAILLRGIQGMVLSIVEESAHGTKVLRTDLFKNIMLPVPPRIEQDEIVIEVNRIIEISDRMTKSVLEAVERLKEYRSAIIADAVTGKIDVRNIEIPEGTEKGMAA